MKRHLTLTGIYAGFPACTMNWNDRTGNDVHAQYAPLQNPEFRATVCPECLLRYAETYTDIDGADGHIDENAPAWVIELLTNRGELNNG